MMAEQSKIFDYMLHGGDELALAKAQLEHMGGYLGLEIEENARLRAEIERLTALLVEAQHPDQ